MLSWPFFALLDFLFSLICYITNPIVVLFADEYGNLPHILRWWQTYDNCLDVEWMISEDNVPDIFKYDFNKHYIYHLEDKHTEPIVPGYVEIIDPNFTIKERIQRYFCRLAWLYRNTGYGFAYEVTGRDYEIAKIIKHVSYKVSSEDECKVYTLDDDRDFPNKTFKIYYCKPWCKWFYLRIYLGWKVTEPDAKISRAMTALYLWPFRTRKNK